METLIPVLQADLIGIVLMVIVLMSLIKNFRSGVVADKLFCVLVVSVMLVCFMEIMGSIFNYHVFWGAKALNRFFNAVLFAINPVPALLWALFAHCKIYQNEERLKKDMRYLVIPLSIVVTLSMANLFTDVFFTISEDNVYARSDFFLLSTLLSVFYIVYVIVIIILQRKYIDRALYVPLFSFMVLPAIGLTLQFFFYGLYMLWVSVAISVLIIFNHVQNDYSITDWLTGLYNRKHLDNYLQQMCRRKRENLLVGLMIDIDFFKEVNDRYGHLVGDNALRETANLLKRAMGNKAYVSRYAGDEFVVIIELKDEEAIQQTIEQLQDAIRVLNQTTKAPYHLALSIGYAIFKGRDMESEDEFLSRMDKQMYRVKHQRKQLGNNDAKCSY